MVNVKSADACPATHLSGMRVTSIYREYPPVVRFTDPSCSKMILFCATDPGGAKNIAPVTSKLSVQCNVLALCSIRTHRFFDEVSVPVEVTEVSSVNAAKHMISEINPDIVVLGTAVADRPEALLTQAAISLGIPTVAILDEWYLYALRFQNKDGKFTHLPTAICCQDELAYNEAIAEGIPVELLKVTGSPALSLMFEHICENTQKGGVTEGTKIPSLLFISEQMAAGFGSAPGESGFVGDFMGYTELDVRNDIAGCLTKLGSRCRVFEKLHPNEFELIDTPERGTNVDWTVLPADASLSDSIQAATAVIGMRSIALLEAAMMGLRPASYQPRRIGADQCTAARLGLADSLSTQAALEQWLKRMLFGEKSFSSQSNRPPFATPEAIDNVCAVIQTIIGAHAPQKGKDN